MRASSRPATNTLQEGPMMKAVAPASCQICLAESGHFDTCPRRPNAPTCNGCGTPLELCVFGTPFCGLPSLQEELEKLRGTRSTSARLGVPRWPRRPGEGPLQRSLRSRARGRA